MYYFNDEYIYNFFSGVEKFQFNCVKNFLSLCRFFFAVFMIKENNHIDFKSCKQQLLVVDVDDDDWIQSSSSFSDKKITEQQQKKWLFQMMMMIMIMVYSSLTFFFRENDQNQSNYYYGRTIPTHNVQILSLTHTHKWLNE